MPTLPGRDSGCLMASNGVDLGSSRDVSDAPIHLLVLRL
jgi:hypothetical protein